jgi:3-methyl-2-oxobutanoate hydroxymethyltransferase
MPSEKNDVKNITVPWVAAAPGRGDTLVMVTAYDFPQGRTADAAGVDIILVGDSLAMVVLGHPDTLSVTMEEMIHHCRAVRRGVKRALLVADMPYGSFHLGADQAVSNAIRFIKDSGAQAVKIEGGRPELVAALTAAEVPVMAHLGLTPQSVHRLGGFKVQGRDDKAKQVILDAAVALEDAGAFSLVLECVPTDLAAEISDRLEIPTIGIGAGPSCDGQVLVYHDLLGLEERIAPRFVRRYAELGLLSREAIERFSSDVRTGRFPAAGESYGVPARPVEEAVGKLYG